MKKGLLVCIPVFEGGFDALRDNFGISEILDDGERTSFLKSNGAAIEAVLTSGTKGVTADEMALMPNLRLICCVGAGYENVDVALAKERGIAISHGPGTNDVCVADHTMALLFAIVRRIVAYDAQVKAGGWKTAGDSWPTLTGKTMGILGMGRIGLRIAARAGGFEMAVHYHNRNRRDDVDFVYQPSALDLAKASDFLISVAPGGKETYHMIDATVLEALGPNGYLVSVGRGTVVDNDALAAALRDGTIAAAGLDVFEGEPDAPQALLEAPNLTITPHVAGRAPESRAAIVSLFQRNLKNFFAGEPLATPIPEMAGD